MTTPQRFAIGQAVTPRVGVFKGVSKPAPQQGEVYHVSSYFWGQQHPNGSPYWYILLVEISGYCYYEAGFEPVEVTTEQIEALVEESISQPVQL